MTSFSTTWSFANQVTLPEIIFLSSPFSTRPTRSASSSSIAITSSKSLRMSMADLPKQYDPQDAQRRWYDFWVEKGYFHADPSRPNPPYSIVIPPPNVTGALHLGHALNNTLQDILIRWRRMQGFDALWMPGTDHAGIATQAVVEKRLLEEEKKTRHDLGREALVERIWVWKDEYEKRILSQLRLMGCSCDWERTRFTLDPTCARAVRLTFFRLFQDDKIYRGKRLVNWDTHLRTAVADDEIYYEDVQGHLWTIKYPVAGSTSGEALHVATTRPETMLGDTAVAVHPDDPRFKHLIGKSVDAAADRAARSRSSPTRSWSIRSSAPAASRSPPRTTRTTTRRACGTSCR